jgi:hypothetical protein
MIDVHPAHHAAGTWREFFIHIATIVLGLLIAIGLEQTVEYFHHRHQLHVARRAIRDELTHDQAAIEYDIAMLRIAEQSMQKNASLLQSARRPNDSPTSVLEYPWQLHFLRDDAWQDAKSSGAAAFMSPAERARLGYIYSGVVDRERTFAISYLTGTNIAKSIAQRAATLNGLTPQDRDQLLKLTSDTEGQVVSLRMLLEIADEVLKSYFDETPQDK